MNPMLQFPLVKRSEASGGDVQPKEWTPGKQDLIDTVRAINTNLDQLRSEVNLDPLRTSTPTQPRKSRTEEKRLLLKNNVENIEHLSKQIRDLHISDDDFDEDDVLLLDYATEIAKTMPELLEGNYQQRLNTVNKLTRSSEEVLREKSRRLAGMQPTENDPLRDEQERKRLEWTLKEKDRKEKEDEKGEKNKKDEKKEKNNEEY